MDNLAAWSQCTNLGLRVRLRTCDNPAAKNGVADCPGSKIEREACANGNWATWEQWSLCTGGERSRKRTCTDPSPLNGGTDCDAAGIVNERQNCTNGKWSTWSTWSDCNGVKITRVRTCTNPSPSIGGKQCAEAANEEQNCAHGGWDQWTQWSCGLPYYFRTRKCNQPAPLNGGLQCITTGNSGKIQQKVCGASVGGLVGALTVLLAIIYVWFCFYKKLCCFKREDPYEKEEIELQKKK